MLPFKTIFRIINFSPLSHNTCNLISNGSLTHKPLASFSYIPLGKTLNVNRSLHISPNYNAKTKDKKKDKNKSKVQVNENQLSEVINLDSLKTQMQKAVETLKDEYVKNLSVRTNAGSIEGIPVELDGKTHTLQELAQIVRKNPKTLVVNMSVFPQAIPAALKAIQKSGMNLNPQQDGTTLYIPVPKVTTEHRESLAKSAKTLFIKCRDTIKDVQNKQVKSLKRKDKLAEDLVRTSEQQIITIADGYISQAEKIMESKQKELLCKE